MRRLRSSTWEPQSQAVEDDLQAVGELGVADLRGVGGRRGGVGLGEVVVASRGPLGGGHQAGDEGGLGLPGSARHSIAGALAVAHGDADLVHAAREAFTASMSTTFTVSAIGVLAAALLATLIMRDTRPKPEPTAPPAHESGAQEPELVA